MSDTIQCRAAVELSADATSRNEIVYFPAGIHEITPVAGGIGKPIRVLIDAQTAVETEKRRLAIIAKGKRPYIDHNHDENKASFRPNKFVWRDGVGVVAQGEWTGSGRAAVDGKDYCGFSPVFYVDDKRANPARVVAQTDKLNPNMGGLVNDPAFNTLALWSKNAESIGAPEQPAITQKEKNKMEESELAALRAKNQELEDTVAALKAANAEDDKLTAAEAELKAGRLQIEAEQLRAENRRQSSMIEARNKTEAESAVKAAVKRGAILPKDAKTQGELVARATADPGFLTVINAMQGGNTSLSTRLTGAVRAGIEVLSEAPQAIYGALAKTVSQMAKTRVLADKMALSRELHALYAAEWSPMTAKDAVKAMSFPCHQWDEAIQAADVTDTDWGTMAGTLVSQRTLELLKFMFPPLTAFTTDFSDVPATFNQTIMTRTVSIPSVVSYNTSTGWSDSTPNTDDVPITINAHRGVQIGINENVQAETVRRLFDEIAPAQAYALGKDLMDALYANITDANFTNNSVSTLANFNRNAVIDIATQLNLQGVPIGPNMRSLLLYSTYFGGIQKDSAIVSLAAFQRPELITGQQQTGAEYAINVSSFRVFDAPNLPTNNGNVVGFAGSKSALVIATRVPNDYSSVFPGATGGGVVQLVTNPDIGITVMLVQYVDHKLGKSAQRLALMYGTAAGQGAAGRLLKAASGTGSSQS